MANEFVKAEQVVAGMLGVLVRETALANVVWRDPVPTFVGAKNDTVTIKIPAFTTNRKRAMRSSTALIVDNLNETAVDVKLDTHLYKAIGVSDEEMTLDIKDFSEQITAPAMGSVVMGVDEDLAAAISDSDPARSLDLDPDNPYRSLLRARKFLNKANVPMAGRFLAVGADAEEVILGCKQLSEYQYSGDSRALREAIIGRIAGFTALTIPGLDPGLVCAAHKTAYSLSLVAPKVPAGAAWGARATHKGFSLRVLRDYDPTPAAGGPPQDRLLTDTFMGIGTVEDRGTFGPGGRFVPTVDGEDEPMLIRAVHLHYQGS